MASAWPYANLHLAPDRITVPAFHHSVFLQARCPSCCPTNSINNNLCDLVYQSPITTYQSQIPLAFSIAGHVNTCLLTKDLPRYQTHLLAVKNGTFACVCAIVAMCGCCCTVSLKAVPFRIPNVTSWRKMNRMRKRILVLNDRTVILSVYHCFDFDNFVNQYPTTLLY